MGELGISLVAKLFRFLAALALACALGGAAVAQTAGSSGTAAAERATVRVAVIAEDANGRMLYGTGSGFIVAPNLVVTNAHVVAAAHDQANFGVVVVAPEAEGMLPARIVQYSVLSDLALLEFRGGPDVPPVTISTLEPHPGDAIVALGFPDVDDLHRPADELLRPTVPSRTTGSIASLRDRAPTGDPIPTINHEAVISSGSSGGPLLDECGRVLGVNTWHARATDTQESRSVASRSSQLIDFLENAGIKAQTTSQRCLSFAERVESERAATVDALQAQNRDLTAKLETADRLTRIAVVILIGGTLALFVAVGVLGALLLSRRPHPPIQTIEVHPPKRGHLGVAAIIGAAAIAALIVVAAGIALLRARAGQTDAALEHFRGAITCSLDRVASRDPGPDNTMSFTASGALCVNQRTLYAPARDGRHYQRISLVSGEHSIDVFSIDPATGEFRRERYGLSDSEFSAASQASNATSATGCDSTDAREAVARRNQTMLRFADGAPEQRQVWRCAPAR